MPDLALSYGASIEDLPISKLKGSWINTFEFTEQLRTIDEIVLEMGHINYDGDVDDVPGWQFDHYFEPTNDVVLLPLLFNHMLGSPRRSSIGRYTLSICENIWGGYEEYEDDDRLVGHVHGQEIRRQINVYRKPRPTGP